MRLARYSRVPRSDVPRSGLTAVEYTGGYPSQVAASQMAAEEREGMLKKGPATTVGEVPH